MDRFTFDNANFGVSDFNFLRRMGFDGHELSGIHAEEVARGNIQPETEVITRAL